MTYKEKCEQVLLLKEEMGCDCFCMRERLKSIPKPNYRKMWLQSKNRDKVEPSLWRYNFDTFATIFAMDIVMTCSN